MRASPHHVLTIWIAMMLVLSAATVTHGDIYTWKDANGIVHFSNQKRDPSAQLYLKEIPPTPEELEREAAQRKIEIQNRLEDTTRELKVALDRIEKLTDEAARSQEQARHAAEAAHIAASRASLEAQRSEAASRDSDSRYVTYGSPHYYPAYPAYGFDKARDAGPLPRRHDGRINPEAEERERRNLERNRHSGFTERHQRKFTRHPRNRIQWDTPRRFH